VAMLKPDPSKRLDLVPPRRVDWRSHVETTSGYPYPLKGTFGGASQTQTVGQVNHYTSCIMEESNYEKKTKTKD